MAARVCACMSRFRAPLASMRATTGRRTIHCTAATLDTYIVKDEKEFTTKVLESKNPVVVDFFATWCNPCRILTPLLEEVVAETKGNVDLAKVDIDDLQDLALKYQVQSVPTVLAVREGQIQEKFIGVQEKDHIVAFVNRLEGVSK